MTTTHFAVGVAAEGRARAQLDRVLMRVADVAQPFPPDDIVDLWGLHSFPASDPPANW